MAILLRVESEPELAFESGEFVLRHKWHLTMQSRRFKFSKPTMRRAVSLLVLVAVCAAAVPIPLGVIYREAKDISEPFPCQHCSCGCKNAEQCWINCCCFTPAQKIAWAKENGVTPPWYAAKVEQTKAKTPAATCEKCTAARPPACAHCASTETPQSACCAAKGNDCRESSSQVESAQAEPEPTIVLSIMALRCKGAANLYTHLPWAIVHPILNERWTIEVLGRCSPPLAIEPARVFLVPDIPPPRMFS